MKRDLLNPFLALALISAATLAAMPAMAQSLSGPPAAPQYKYSTPMPPGVVAPDTLETRFGTLNFFDGFPDKASVDKLNDNLDFQRAVQGYLLALPVVNQIANRDAILAFGPANTTVPIWENLTRAPSGSPSTTTRRTLGCGSICTAAHWSSRCHRKCSD